jgi:molybdopterin synthase sulfur carrier subunit
MRVTVRFYGHLQELLIGKTTGEYDLADSATISDLLDKLLQDEAICDTIFDETKTLKPEITLLKNGREIKFLDGLTTELEAGDEISVFPIVAGG